MLYFPQWMPMYYFCLNTLTWHTFFCLLFDVNFTRLFIMIHETQKFNMWLACLLMISLVQYVQSLQTRSQDNIHKCMVHCKNSLRQAYSVADKKSIELKITTKLTLYQLKWIKSSEDFVTSFVFKKMRLRLRHNSQLILHII